MFTIMPFSVREADLDAYGGDTEHWTEVFEGVIAPAARAVGLAAERDDADLSSRLISENVWKKIERADLVLCDLSSGNPNVFLELGWALRADKKFVLIKDDRTNYQFDLNQFHTYTYSHRLQPSEVRRAVQGLAQTIRQTLADPEKRYSLVRRLALDIKAIEASGQGNIEVDLLLEVLDELRMARRPLTPSAVRPNTAPKVMIFWHEEGLTKDDALALVGALDEVGVWGVIAQHYNGSAPDAVYIGRQASPKLIRLLLTAVPVPVRYIFPVDYPDAECGAQSEFVMSVGLHSVTRQGYRPREEEPIPVTAEQLNWLTDGNLKAAEFRRRLNAILSYRA
jgi:hypothetical protein